MTIATSTKLGRYEIRSKIGEGGIGEVYRACDTQLGRDVAIKVIPSSLAVDKDRLRRFEQEACAAGALTLRTFWLCTTSLLTMGLHTLSRNY